MTTWAPASFGAGLPQCWNPWRARTNTDWRLGMFFNSHRSLRSSPTCRSSGIRLVTRTQHGMLYFSFNSISFGETSLIPATAAHVEIQSAHALAELAEELKAAGSPVQLVEARSSVRDRLRAE